VEQSLVFSDQPATSSQLEAHLGDLTDFSVTEGGCYDSVFDEFYNHWDAFLDTGMLANQEECA